MNIIENLVRYTEYSKGDLSKKCSLEYEDIDIVNIDFSKYDLNNSFFSGVKFLKCNFSDVYLSGSNFGGSFLEDCLLKKNIIRKATWDDMTFLRTQIICIDAFKTTFMFGKFRNVNFEKGCFNKCSFANSELLNIYFKEVTIIDTDFSECKLQNVHFVKCKLENVKFDEQINNQNIFFE